MKWVLEHCAVPGVATKPPSRLGQGINDIIPSDDCTRNAAVPDPGIFNIFICAGDLSSELENVMCVFKFLVANYDAVFKFKK